MYRPNFFGGNFLLRSFLPRILFLLFFVFKETALWVLMSLLAQESLSLINTKTMGKSVWPPMAMVLPTKVISALFANCLILSSSIDASVNASRLLFVKKSFLMSAFFSLSHYFLPFRSVVWSVQHGCALEAPSHSDCRKQYVCHGYQRQPQVILLSFIMEG